jgi:riboflavin kinase/FMN adenylyltransferase
VKIIRHAGEFSHAKDKVCVAMGMFDGVHRGHQRVLSQTVADAAQHDALAAAVTFDRHPSSVLAPSRTPPLIYPLAQRLRVMESMGIQTVLLIHFDREFSQQAGESFIRALASGFRRIQSVCVGKDFVFGFRRTGNVALLKKLGQELGFDVHAISPVLEGKQTISSTRIRQAIQAGKLDLVAQLLGRPYSIAADVVPGDRLGQKLGFPTANLNVTGLALPPSGVYAGRAEADGRWHLAVANVGVRPTLERPVPELRLEVHLVEFDGDLYGRPLEFEFGSKLRGEQKFASLEALKEQIGRDISAAQALPG